MPPWSGIITEEEERRYASAGFGGTGGFGKRPALLIIDVQYRTVGTERKPYWEAIKEYPTSCGDVGWDAVDNIAPLLAVFRAKGFPVLYPHVAPKNAAMELFREAVLGLADHHAFARGFVNSGRLSVAHQCIDSPLVSPDEGDFAGGVAPGCPARGQSVFSGTQE